MAKYRRKRAGIVSAIIGLMRSASPGSPISKKAIVRKVLSMFPDRTESQISHNTQWVIWAGRHGSKAQRSWEGWFGRHGLKFREFGPPRRKEFCIEEAERTRLPLVNVPVAEDDQTLAMREGGMEHLKLERHKRSRPLANKRKQMDGFRCRVCDLTMADFYGDDAAMFAEAHHVVPFSVLKEVRLTGIEELITVCPNCHRILHRREDPADWKGLRRLITRNGTYGAMQWRSG